MFKIVIIGPGSIAHTYMEALGDSENVTVSAVLGNDFALTKAFAEKYNINCYTDADLMYSAEKPDAVLICTPTFTHEEIVKKAIGNKVHIMCEKPFVLDDKTAQNLFDMAEENNIRIMVMQVVRFWPEYKEIKHMVDSGKLGQIFNVYANRLSSHPNWCTWHKDPLKSGGGLYDLHIHDIDWLYHTFGKVKSVYAKGMQTESGCWNNVSTIMNFESGVSAVAEGFMDITGKWDFSTNVRINGSIAAVEYLNKKVYLNSNEKNSVNSFIVYNKDCEQQLIDVSRYNPYKAEVEYFTDCVVNNKTTDIVTADDVIYVLKILKAIEKSLSTGMVQNIE